MAFFFFLFDLTENADQQQKKEFLDELELMKPMAPHPNIVGLVGCCTKSGELSLHRLQNGTVHYWLTE